MVSGHQDESSRQTALEQLASLQHRLDHHDRLLEQLAATTASLAERGPVLEGRLALVEDGVDDVLTEVRAGAAGLRQELLAAADRQAGTATPEDVLRQVELLRVSVGEALRGVHSWLVEQETARHDRASRFELLVEDLVSGVQSRVLATLEQRLAGVEDASAAVLTEARQAMAALIELVDVNARTSAAASAARVDRLAEDVVSRVEQVVQTTSTRDSAVVDRTAAQVGRLVDGLLPAVESRVVTVLDRHLAGVEQAGAAVSEARQALAALTRLADDTSRTVTDAAVARVDRAARTVSARDSAVVDRAGARLDDAVQALLAASSGLRAAELDRRRTEGELADLLRTLLGSPAGAVAVRPRLVDRLLGRSVEQDEPPRSVGAGPSVEDEPSPDLPALPAPPARRSRPEPAAARLRPATPRSGTGRRSTPRAAAADGPSAGAAGDGGTAAAAATAAPEPPARRAPARAAVSGQPAVSARKAPARKAGAASAEEPPVGTAGDPGQVADPPAAPARSRKASARTAARRPTEVADQPGGTAATPD